MVNVLDMPHFANGFEGFICALSKSRLLSACGGPYPNHIDVQAAASWKIAIGSIADAMLDATPHHILDKMLVEARCEALKLLKPSWIRSLTGRGFAIEKKIEQFMDEVVSRLSPPAIFERAEINVVRNHLMHLFTTTGLLLRAGNLPHFYCVALASYVAMSGFLPVDIIYKSDGENRTRLLIY